MAKRPSNSISKKEARALFINSQLLNGVSKTPLQIIEHLGYVQIDTISVVERAHHHVFWSRNSRYRPEDLTALMKKRKVFEYWSHAASILPMKEYRFSSYSKKKFREKERGWFPRDAKLMKQVLERIKKEGPLQSRDFKNTKKPSHSGWWDWKPAKQALERLFMEGELEVSRRDSFRKVYDLPERVIPSSTNTSAPTDGEFFEYLVERTLRSHGLATVDEIGYLFSKKERNQIQKVIDEFVENKKLVELSLEGEQESYYAKSSTLTKNKLEGKGFIILSPFDNMVIQREKLERLFGFQYQIECYVTEKKRRYGYFSLPILMGDSFVARMDCKAHRKVKQLDVLSFHNEKKSISKTKLLPELKSFAEFNSCENIKWIE